MTRSIAFSLSGIDFDADNIPDEVSLSLPAGFEHRPIEELVRQAADAWRDQLAAVLEPAMPPRGSVTSGPFTVAQPRSRKQLAHELATKIAVADRPSIRRAIEAQRHEPERRP
jgi:hypothetical protein